MSVMTDIPAPRSGFWSGIAAFFDTLAAGQAAATEIEHRHAQGSMGPDEVRVLYLRHFG